MDFRKLKTKDGKMDGPQMVERSVSLRDVMARKWREEIKRRSPSDRLQFLGSTEGRAALGVKPCEEMIRKIRKDEKRMSELVCGAEWLEAWYARNTPPPINTPDGGRQHSVRLMLSRGLVRYGWEGIPHRRWTPPQAVELEDMIDCMGDVEALVYPHPPSPSALAIQRMAFYTRKGLRRLAR